MKELPTRLPQRRHVTDAWPGPSSTALTERRTASVAAALSPSLPGFVVDADGGVLVDADGNSIIDFASGIAVTSVGASHPKVATAVAEAAGHLTHTCFMVSPYESYVAVAERLNELVGPGSKTVLLNSGAEAVENAVKIARAATGKTGVVVFDHAYHGRTNLTMAMTAKNKPYKSGFGPFASDVFRAPTSYPLRDGLTGEQAAQRTITMIEQEVGAENLACVVMEPIQGEGGFIVPADGFLREVVAWCNANNVLFIADEIQAGMCRTGKWFSYEYAGITPDLVTIAKALAGGLPLSAVTGKAEYMDAACPGGLGGTYGGNPVACAAALAALDVMVDDDLCGRARDIEAIIREELDAIAGLDEVAEIRGRGAMIAIEFVHPDGTPNPTLVADVVADCKAQGVLLLSCGLSGNVIRLLPPLVIGEELLRDGLGVLTASVRAHAGS